MAVWPKWGPLVGGNEFHLGFVSSVGTSVWSGVFA